MEIQVTDTALEKIRELEDPAGAYPKSNLEGEKKDWKTEPSVSGLWNNHRWPICM